MWILSGTHSKKSIPHFKEILIMWYILLLEFDPCSCLRAFKSILIESQNDDVYGFRLWGILIPKSLFRKHCSHYKWINSFSKYFLGSKCQVLFYVLVIHQWTQHVKAFGLWGLHWGVKDIEHNKFKITCILECDKGYEKKIEMFNNIKGVGYALVGERAKKDGLESSVGWSG